MADPSSDIPRYQPETSPTNPLLKKDKVLEKLLKVDSTHGVPAAKLEGKFEIELVAYLLDHPEGASFFNIKESITTPDKTSLTLSKFRDTVDNINLAMIDLPFIIDEFEIDPTKEQPIKKTGYRFRLQTVEEQLEFLVGGNEIPPTFEDQLSYYDLNLIYTMFAQDKTYDSLMKQARNLGLVPLQSSVLEAKFHEYLYKDEEVDESLSSQQVIQRRIDACNKLSRYLDENKTMIERNTHIPEIAFLHALYKTKEIQITFTSQKEFQTVQTTLFDFIRNYYTTPGMPEDVRNIHP